MKNKNSTKDSPYYPTKFPVKLYFSDIYIPVKGRAVPVEESLEELSGNIGEKLKLESRDLMYENPEINSEIKKSESSYSVEGETYANTNI